MNSDDIPFSKAILTSAASGLPSRLRTVQEALAAVETARLPMRRSGPAWLEVHKRLATARADGACEHAERARRALAITLDAEDGGTRCIQWP